MKGSTPPPAIVARTSMSSSSSPRIASCKCRGVMRLTWRSFEALPNSTHSKLVVVHVSAHTTYQPAPILQR